MSCKFNKLYELLFNRTGQNVSPKLRKVIQDYTFQLISDKLCIEQNKQIYDNLQKSKVIVIDHYEDSSSKTSDLYFIISFRKTILLIKQSDLNFIHHLLTFKNNIKFLFLTEKKDIFDQNLKIDYNELKNDQNIFNIMLSNCNRILLLKIESKFCLNDFWSKIRSCISAFLIENSYQKLTKYRYKKFKSEKEKLSKPEIFDEDDFIELRIVGNGSIFKTELNYHIYKEKIFVIKKPNILDDEIPKLLKREVGNYSKISHHLLPRFYGTIKNSNYPVIEFIN